MLCIATPNPDSLVETFIRQHIRKLAPDNTVILYFQGQPTSLLTDSRGHVWPSVSVVATSGDIPLLFLP